MARLIGPDEASREVKTLVGRVFQSKGGRPAQLWADAGATIPADVLTIDGAPIPNSTVTIDSVSMLPLVQFPPGDVDVVYATCDGGPAWPIYARTDDRLDSLAGRVDGVSSALQGKRDIVPTVIYLDAYNQFFGGVGWVTGQGNTATTLSAPAAQGAPTLTVTSATGLLTGVLLVTGAGTAAQQLLTITNVAGNVLTVSPAVGTALASGATVAPVWTNSSHITWDSVGGSRAYGYWLANYKRADGSYVISGGAGQTVVWLGDSWTSECLPEFEAELDARLGPTTVVNAGVGGNKLSQMIARFGTDVAPLNPDVVVLEYGVNDVYQGVTSATMAAELEQAVALCRSVGAQVVIPGMPPLADFPAASRDRNVELAGQTAGPDFPSQTLTGLAARLVPTQRNASSVRLGEGTQPLATGVNNTAIGANSQSLLTTGVNNTAIGKDTQSKITTVNYATAMGQGVQFNATGGENTGVGGLAQFVLTGGVGNVAVGRNAQYSPAGVTANGTTTANYQTCVGYGTGQAGTSQDDRITTVGYNATASGSASTALGSQATAGQVGSLAVGGSSAASGINSMALGGGTAASGQGSVAIGRDSTGIGASASATNQFVLGTDKHLVTVPGTLKLPAGTAAKVPLNIAPGVAPTTPVDGDMWTTTAGLFVRINGVTVGPLS